MTRLSEPTFTIISVIGGYVSCLVRHICQAEKGTIRRTLLDDKSRFLPTFRVGYHQRPPSRNDSHMTHETLSKAQINGFSCLVSGGLWQIEASSYGAYRDETYSDWQRLWIKLLFRMLSNIDRWKIAPDACKNNRLSEEDIGMEWRRFWSRVWEGFD